MKRNNVVIYQAIVLGVCMFLSYMFGANGIYLFSHIETDCDCPGNLILKDNGTYKQVHLYWNKTHYLSFHHKEEIIVFTYADSVDFDSEIHYFVGVDFKENETRVSIKSSNSSYLFGDYRIETNGTIFMEGDLLQKYLKGNENQVIIQ